MTAPIDIETCADDAVLTALFLRAWNKQDTETQLRIHRRTWALRGKPMPVRFDTRDAFQRDFDEEQDGSMR